MNSDNNTRIPLPTNKGYILTITDNDNMPHRVTICDELGQGGSCIVYSGTCTDSVGSESVECSVIIKEFYPSSCQSFIKRKQADCFLSIEDNSAQKRFDSLLAGFCKGQKKHAQFFR